MNEIRQMAAKEVNTLILNALDQKPKPDLAISPDFCLEDLGFYPTMTTQILAWASLLKAMNGRTVRQVKWVTGPSRDNPVAEPYIGRFIVELEPK